VADGWCWFVLREKYCWLVVGDWFVLREKYCWLVADKTSEQAVGFYIVYTPTTATWVGTVLGHITHGVRVGRGARGRRDYSTLRDRSVWIRSGSEV
jgi:hypothetical protein